MAWFSRLSIRYRLILLMVFVSTLALAVAGTALVLMDLSRQRQSLSDELHSLARLVGNRSHAALVFGDADTAAETLAALGGIPHVAAGCLFDKAGRPFAAYVRDPHSRVCQARHTLSRGGMLGPGALVVEEAVSEGGAIDGRVQVHATDGVLLQRLGRQLASLAAVLVCAFGVAVWLAWRLQATISRPIAQVRDVAQAIMDSGNFELRAPESGEHELGKLARAFNLMLDTLHEHNLALAASEAYARRLFHDSHLAQIVALASDKRFIDCNGAALRLFGLAAPEQLIGASCLALSPTVQPGGEASAVLLDAIWAQLAGHGVAAAEWRHTRADGSEWDAALHMMRFEHRGEALIHFSLEDITRRKRDEEAIRALNHELEDRVQRRTRELADANGELQATLERLRRTQDELVQREKLASLGNLVAGVAHELNTPLGNGITVCTALQEELHLIERDFAAGVIKRNALREGLTALRSGLDLLERNLGRASSLVSHFKQAAVDQVGGQRRRFDLRDAVVDVVETLEPQFKRSPHRVEVDIPAGIAMDSYPGPLGQVVVNLALNALVHAFGPDMHGRLMLRARAVGADQVELRVEDNGCGIPAEHIGKVFDPFFTTRLGQGGSGLGLHIVYNVVVGTLGGTIRLDSRPGEGTVFTLRLPRQAPEHPEPDGDQPG